ncbi:hypothetical protein [Dokdonella sp.]|uniref:hypothetical protein n=1 Tax=Dokdonella sp. TaxID=2291710 RepID=UPI003C6ED746
MIPDVARVVSAVACLMMFSSLAAQETYSQRYSAASQRRAESSMEQFQSRLSESRASGDRSESRILLSFNELVPARDVIAVMDAIGIEIEDLQTSVGESLFSFSIGQADRQRAEASIAQQLARSVAIQVRQDEWLLANESNEKTRYWLKEGLRFFDAYQASIEQSQVLFISGAGCVASNDQIERLMQASPSLIRAIEFQGTLRMMSIPLEAYKGPGE